MKKYNLFKIIGIVILAYCILTWIIPASYYSGGLQQLGSYVVGIPSLIEIPLQSLGYFCYIFIFILAVGSFYSVLEATGLYRNLLDKMVKKTSKKKQCCLIVVTVLVAIISSITGLEFGMFVVLPFLISYLMLIGYDKITALLATLGATLIGMFGSTYGYTMYGIGNSILSLKASDGILVKIILFVLGLGALLTVMLLHNNIKDKKAKNTKVKSKDKKADAKKEEAKVEKLEKFIPKKVEIDKNKKGCKKLWPFVTILVITLVVFILGTINWSSTFNISIFNDANTAITSSNFFGKLLGGSHALGTWVDHSRFLCYSAVILLATILLALIYKIKINDYLKAIFEGAKENVTTGALIALAYTLLVIVSSFPIFLTIANWFINLFGGKFNIVTSGITSMLGSFLYVDMYYYPQYVLQYYAGLTSANASILNVLIVSIYSVTMLVVPTSPLLIAMLTTTDTSYKEWLKNIWKLFVALVAIVFIVLTIFFVI